MEDAQQPRREVVPPAVGVDQSRLARSGIAIALTVKSRRPRSASIASVGATTGSAPGVRVGLGAGGGDVDLVAVELDLGGGEALVLDRLRPEPRRQRRGVADDDEVEVGAAAAEQQVADGAADDVDRLLGGGRDAPRAPGRRRAAPRRGPRSAFQGLAWLPSLP